MIVPLSKIRPAATALRKVDKTSAKFLEIVASIPKFGILNPPNVQEREDEETGEKYFELCDGLHRFTAAIECGLEEIPVHVVEFDEVNTLVAQVHANYAKVETKTSEFSKQLIRIMQKIKTMTEAELAEMTGFSLEFIRNRLKLNKIESEEIWSLIDGGKINIQNAYALASLPVEEHEAFKEDAITETPQAFLAEVKKRNKELKEARKQGREETDEFPGASPRLRSLKDLKVLLDDKAPVMQFVTDGMSPDEIVETTINYVMNLDPISVEEAKAKWEANQARRKEQAERRAQDKKKKAAEKAQERAAKAKAEADAAMAEALGEVPAEAPAEETAEAAE